MMLDQILDLAMLARRSPYARRILHDALIERYGGDYTTFVERAHRYANEDLLAWGVFLNPSQLQKAEDAWRERGERGVPVLHRALDAIVIYPPSERIERRAQDALGTEQLVYLARPEPWLRPFERGQRPRPR